MSKASWVVLLPLLALLTGRSFSLLAPRLPRPMNSAPGPYAYVTKTFQQQVDHFNYENNATFDQRYLINTEWWKPGGPILFYTGNEGDITWFCNNTGFVWDYAPQLGAMVIFSEHRYYGSSLPFGEDSFKAENIHYLSVEQALADHATLLYHIKSTMASNSSVLTVGGSYGGMLAAWMRMKYPNLVNGSFAASAPIWQVGDLTPCERPYKVLTDAFRMGGKLCPLAIRMSWDSLTEMSQTEKGRQWIEHTFNLCEPIKEPGATELQSWLQSAWFYLALANYPYPADFLERLPGHPVKMACSHLDEVFRPGKELLTAIASAASVYYNYYNQADCLNTSQVADSSLGSTAWNFQACTEMVLPMCSNGIDDMYPPMKWDMEEYTSSCRSLTGMHVTPKPDWLVQRFGGKDITSYSNIIFSNGLLDPWSAGGVLHSLSSDLIAVTIKDGAHHLDLRAADTLDPDDVKKARDTELSYIKKFLNSQ